MKREREWKAGERKVAVKLCGVTVAMFRAVPGMSADLACFGPRMTSCNLSSSRDESTPNWY
jgi:hypothetical protein